MTLSISNYVEHSLFCKVMSGDNFHMFLASNTNPSIFPDNKPSKFSTLYGENINLNGDWEVGVKSITYPNDIFTTTGIEKMTISRNKVMMVEGEYPSAISNYCKILTYSIPKPSFKKGVGYDYRDIIKNFNETAIAKRGVVKLIFDNESNLYMLRVYPSDVYVGFSETFANKILNLPQLGLWGKGLHAVSFASSVADTKEWLIWVFPLYRMEYSEHVICEANDDMSIDDMVKRIRSLCGKDVTFKLNKKTVKNVNVRKLELTDKPDPRTAVGNTIISFDVVAEDVLGLMTAYYYPGKYEYNTAWKTKSSFKESSWYRKRPMTMRIYNRKMANQSLFIPMEEEGSTYTFARKRYGTAEEILTDLNSYPNSSFDYEFKFNKITKRFSIYLGKLTCIYMDKILCDILGFKYQQIFLGDMTYGGIYEPALDRAIDNLFVYNTITDVVYVGDVKTPLLCIVPREIKRQGGSITYTFDSPIYMNILRRSFNQLDILILDDAGVEVPFANGKTIISLHYRKRV